MNFELAPVFIATRPEAQGGFQIGRPGDFADGTPMPRGFFDVCASNNYVSAAIPDAIRSQPGRPLLQNQFGIGIVVGIGIVLLCGAKRPTPIPTPICYDAVLLAAKYTEDLYLSRVIEDHIQDVG